jgi:hypothetical protein
MASHHTIAIFAACFAVLVLVIAVQGDMPGMPGMVATPAPAPGVVAPPTSAPSPNGSTSNLTYSSMGIGLVATFIVTVLRNFSDDEIDLRM